MAQRRVLRRVAGVSGVVGPIVLVASFAINPSPPPGLSVQALERWAQPREELMLLGSWLQGIGSLLIVLFALMVVELSGMGQTLAARITQLSAGTILMVSLTEVTFYLAAAQAAASQDMALGLVASGLIKAVQHVFLIAPALLLPLGFVIAKSRILPPAFAASAFVLGATLQTLGLVGLFGALQPVVDAILIVQSLWFVAAAGVVGLGPSPQSRSLQAA